MAAYSQSTGACLADEIGGGGLAAADLAAARQDAAAAAGRLQQEHAAGSIAFSRIAGGGDDLPVIEQAAAGLSRRFRDLYIVGTGGSSLGGKALAAIRAPGAYANAPRLHFCENADPGSPALRADFGHDAGPDLAASGFLVVSKSGGTAEVLALFAHFWRAATDRLGADARERFTVVTSPGDGPLRRLAEERGLAVLDHPPDLGGRYSALSLVGLIPAAVAGVDAAAVRAGAAAVLTDFLERGVDSDPAGGAAVNAGLMRAGASAHVLMPYADSLGPFARWFCQLWGESLGKDGQGSLPYPAVGAVDQHSQLQLWLDGPPGAAFTLISPNHQAAAAAAPLDTGGSLPWLDGHALGDLIAAQYRATAVTLAARGRPVRTLDLHAATVGEREIGALMMHFMLETVLTGYILGIDPFNQPAVEDGKQRTRKLLSGGGGED